MNINPLLLLIFFVSGCAGIPASSVHREEHQVSSAQSMEKPSEYENSSEFTHAVSRKIKGNTVLPPNLSLTGNPQVVVSFTLAASGKATNLKITKSSGSRQLDSAILQAIERSAPLPILSSWKDTDKAEKINLIYSPYE